MMMCSRCHKRPAVVFISPTVNAQETKGLCLVCAKELGIKPVNDLMEKMGITEEQMEAMEPDESRKQRRKQRGRLHARRCSDLPIFAEYFFGYDEPAEGRGDAAPFIHA